MMDVQYWRKGLIQLCGIDEAGRGPLAGPLVVAAVIFNPHDTVPGVDDSKKLSPQKRERLAVEIKDLARAYHIEVVDVKTIDTLNIYQATKVAMLKAVVALTPEFTLTDAMPLGSDVAHDAIIKGDQKSQTIAAASILAKVTRDALMKDYAQIYPEYGFAQHKGYATKMHLDALMKYGPTPIHRRSFAPVMRALEKQMSLL